MLNLTNKLYYGEEIHSEEDEIDKNIGNFQNNNLCSNESALSPSFSENSVSTTNTIIDKYQRLKKKNSSKETTPSNDDGNNFKIVIYYYYFRRKTICLHS